jgi:hypothetical protein
MTTATVVSKLANATSNVMLQIGDVTTTVEILKKVSDLANSTTSTVPDANELEVMFYDSLNEMRF